MGLGSRTLSGAKGYGSPRKVSCPSIETLFFGASKVSRPQTGRRHLASPSKLAKDDRRMCRRILAHEAEAEHSSAGIDDLLGSNVQVTPKARLHDFPESASHVGAGLPSVLVGHGIAVATMDGENVPGHACDTTSTQQPSHGTGGVGGAWLSVWRTMLSDDFPSARFVQKQLRCEGPRRGRIRDLLPLSLFPTDWTDDLRIAEKND